MPLSRDEARDDILATVAAAVDAYNSGHDPDVVLIKDGVTDQPPKDGRPWMRMAVLHGGAQQAGLTGETGLRRFERDGSLMVQVFTRVGDGFTLADALCKVLTDALEGKRSLSGGVVFRRVRANEIGKSGAYDQANVIADFAYDEIK